MKLDYNIKIVSKEEAILIDIRNMKYKTIVISINCPNEKPHIFRNKNIIDTCYIYCDDLTEKEFNKVKTYYENNKERLPTLFNIDMAKQIKTFIDIHKDIKNIIVHCAMGVSRSGAVGVVLSKYLNNGQDMYLYNTGKILPNETVYKIMCNEFNIKYDIDELKRKKRISSKILNERFGEDFKNYGLTIEFKGDVK